MAQKFSCSAVNKQATRAYMHCYKARFAPRLLVGGRWLQNPSKIGMGKGAWKAFLQCVREELKPQYDFHFDNSFIHATHTDSFSKSKRKVVNEIREKAGLEAC